ncbi:MAG: N-acetylneuraminate synthase family protein [Deltaproteobacteria bacterium]|nr:N-acetylneuraminate synthase family protein [Deltaproteobacteria bacterium]
MRRTFRIGEKKIGMGSPAYIIAEIGSNHDSSLDRAKELIKAARYAGADAVKLQSFTAEGLINRLRPDDSGRWVPHPAYPVIERLTVPVEWHHILMEFSKTLGITFLSAPFDEARAELLNTIGVEAFKIASGDLTNDLLLRQVARYGKPVVLSTGASYLSEVARAVKLITGEGNQEIALLHCASLYPPSYDEVNIRSMATLKDNFKCPVGFSDHTPGSTVPLGAVALGASIIEKHITFDRTLAGPDHPYAMEVEEFKSMVAEIRNLEKALGDGVKQPSKHEMGERIGARRSIYAKIDICKGTVIEPSMLKLVRHAYGLEPRDMEGVVGKAASKDLKKDMPLKREDICH